MSARPDLVRLKYSTDGDAAIRAAIATGGSDEIQTGELVVGVEQLRVRLYSKDASGRIVTAVPGPETVEEVDGGDFNTSFPILNIGDVYGGGYYAGSVSYAQNGVADYALIVAPKGEGSFVGAMEVAAATSAADICPSQFDGFANTNAINNADHPAAFFCRSLTINGYNDWYVPSLWELDVIYNNLKPTGATNNTTTHTYTNLIALTDPPRTGYTSGDPAQTTATLYQSGESEAFGTGIYWSSTSATGLAERWTAIRFSDGNYYSNLYGYGTYSVRAIRRVAI